MLFRLLASLIVVFFLAGSAAAKKSCSEKQAEAAAKCLQQSNKRFRTPGACQGSVESTFKQCLQTGEGHGQKKTTSGHAQR